MFPISGGKSRGLHQAGTAIFKDWMEDELKIARMHRWYFSTGLGFYVRDRNPKRLWLIETAFRGIPASRDIFTANSILLARRDMAIPRAYRDLVTFFPHSGIKAVSRSLAVIGPNIAISILPQQFPGVATTDPFAVGWPIVIGIVGMWPVEEWIIVIPVPPKINHRALVGLAMKFVKLIVGIAKVRLFWVIALMKPVMLLQKGRTERRTLSLCGWNDGRTGRNGIGTFHCARQPGQAAG